MLRTSSVAASEIASLEHEIWNHTVENGALVPESLGSCALLTSAQSTTYRKSSKQVIMMT